MSLVHCEIWDWCIVEFVRLVYKLLGVDNVVRRSLMKVCIEQYFRMCNIPFNTATVVCVAIAGAPFTNMD